MNHQNISNLSAAGLLVALFATVGIYNNTPEGQRARSGYYSHLTNMCTDVTNRQSTDYNQLYKANLTRCLKTRGVPVSSWPTI